MATEIVERPKESAVLYPPDRRFVIRVRSRELRLALVAMLIAVAAAWVHYLIVGLPAVPPSGRFGPREPGPIGFPGWMRVTHYINLLFLVLIARSGLQILWDHPRLYWAVHCTPGTEWLRVTPLEVPRDRVWTAKDDAWYLSPWLGLPGYRHTVGIARHWHFLGAGFWLINGLVFVALLFGTGQWRRLVPTSWGIVPDAWAVFVHYATFHLPVEPDGFYRYNPLQQLAYFAVVFVQAPVQILTGLAMSPALVSRFPWYPKLFLGRQAARSIHFLGLLGFLGFLIAHVSMVVLTGLARNMNHIVMGTDDTHPLGLILGLVGLAAVAGACVGAHWVSWRHPRSLQHVKRAVFDPIRPFVFGWLEPRYHFRKEDISPYFWPNGQPPTCPEWESLAKEDFRGYRLRVFGLVENPVELSLGEMKALGKQEQITMHHCIQGWSGIAEWGGLPLTRLVELVRPTAEARVAVFHSFGEGLHGGEYYDTLCLGDVLHPQTILAYEMNNQPLGRLHGAPLRLRVENQLGYKHVKWVRAVEFVASEAQVGKGHGGKNEDDEYFDLVANI